jgi:hypothetical protein
MPNGDRTDSAVSPEGVVDRKVVDARDAERGLDSCAGKSLHHDIAARLLGHLGSVLPMWRGSLGGYTPPR